MVLAQGEERALEAFAENRRRRARRAAAESSTNAAVRAALAATGEASLRRAATYPERAVVQRVELKLPLLPTTIGSFPQTQEVRRQRRDYGCGV